MSQTAPSQSGPLSIAAHIVTASTPFARHCLRFAGIGLKNTCTHVACYNRRPIQSQVGDSPMKAKLLLPLLLLTIPTVAFSVEVDKLVEAVDTDKAIESVDVDKLKSSVSGTDVDLKKAYDSVDKEKAADSVDMDKIKEALGSDAAEVADPDGK